MQEGRIEFCYRGLRPLAVLVGVWMTKLLSSSSPSVATSADPDSADLAPFLRTSHAFCLTNTPPIHPRRPGSHDNSPTGSNTRYSVTQG